MKNYEMYQKCKISFINNFEVQKESQNNKKQVNKIELHNTYKNSKLIFCVIYHKKFVNINGSHILFINCDNR